MTFEQALRCIALIAEAWPQQTWTEIRTMTWAEFICELADHGLAEEAIRELVRTSSFPPAIADIRSAYMELSGRRLALAPPPKPLIEDDPDPTPEQMREQATRLRALIESAGLRRIPDAKE